GASRLGRHAPVPPGADDRRAPADRLAGPDHAVAQRGSEPDLRAGGRESATPGVAGPEWRSRAVAGQDNEQAGYSGPDQAIGLWPQLVRPVRWHGDDRRSGQLQEPILFAEEGQGSMSQPA